MDITKRFIFDNFDFKVEIFGSIDNLLFKAKDVALALGYENSRQVIIMHVEKKDRFKFLNLCGSLKNKLPQIDPKTIFINESG